MKQYHVRQTENGWIVTEGSPYRESFGCMGKEYVFTDSGAMGAWMAARDVQIKIDLATELAK